LGLHRKKEETPALILEENAPKEHGKTVVFKPADLRGFRNGADTGSERRVLIPLSRALLEAGFQRDDQGVRSQRREARMARPRGVRRYRWRRLLGLSGMVWPRAPEATSLAMVSWR
jgi:hypothetical protein